MSKLVLHILAAAALATVCASVQAQTRSSEADALRLLAQAQGYVKANGLEKAIVEFNRLDSPFNSQSAINPHGDLYLYSVAPDGFQAVHGKNPKIRGKVMLDMRDADGYYLIREFVRVCFQTPEGKGWVQYKWPHPISKQVEPKRGYVERVPGQAQFCLGTGIYR